MKLLYCVDVCKVIVCASVCVKLLCVCVFIKFACVGKKVHQHASERQHRIPTWGVAWHGMTELCATETCEFVAGAGTSCNQDLAGRVAYRVASTPARVCVCEVIVC